MSKQSISELGNIVGSSPFPTLNEAAKEKNISPWTLRRAIYDRRLASVRFGGSTRGKIRIRREDLEAFVMRSRTAAFAETIKLNK